jgi:anti-sigma28 factor (negative regulator of flagellin synthesis)
MRILPVSQTLSSEIQKISNAKKPDGSPKVKASVADSSTISAKGQRLNQTQANTEIILNQIANEPDVRLDKIEEVRQKIKNGYYNSPEFMEKLTDRMMRDLGVTKKA